MRQTEGKIVEVIQFLSLLHLSMTTLTELRRGGHQFVLGLFPVGAFIVFLFGTFWLLEPLERFHHLTKGLVHQRGTPATTNLVKARPGRFHPDFPINWCQEVASLSSDLQSGPKSTAVVAGRGFSS